MMTAAGTLTRDLTGRTGTHRGLASAHNSWGFVTKLWRRRARRASPPASMWVVGMLACRSSVSAVAVEALMDYVREEGNLELTEALRSNDRS